MQHETYDESEQNANDCEKKIVPGQVISSKLLNVFQQAPDFFAEFRAVGMAVVRHGVGDGGG